MNKDEMAQYKDLFVSTAKKYLETLNNELIKLEKDPGDKNSIDEIFRAAHSLKGQSAAMGYNDTGLLCHVVEDVFYEIKENGKVINHQLADLLFESLDELSKSVQKIDSEGIEDSNKDLIERLKNSAGVNTTGTGKSDHTQKNATETVSNNKTTEPKTAEQNIPKVENKETSEPKLTISTIPVKIELLDNIVGSLEELMIDKLSVQSIIKTLDNPSLEQAQDKLDKIIELVRYQIMKIRTVPINLVFEHFPRTVRDISRMLNKEIDLKIEGGDLELDRSIVERLDEPITHLIRNAADHGIKDKGTITISARADKDYAIVEIKDDGQGIDWDAVAKKSGIDRQDNVGLRKAIFSGISTSDQVSLISGRGVGLEVVKKTIEDLGGQIDIKTAMGNGTSFILRLPINVSVMKMLVVEIDDQEYAISASNVEISLLSKDYEVINSAGREAFRYKDQEIPIVRLNAIQDKKIKDYLVILNVDNEKIAIFADDIISNVETVLKPLPELIKNSEHFSGVSILGNGKSILLINPRGFIE